MYTHGHHIDCMFWNDNRTLQLTNNCICNLKYVSITHLNGSNTLILNKHTEIEYISATQTKFNQPKSQNDLNTNYSFTSVDFKTVTSIMDNMDALINGINFKLLLK